MKLYLPRIKAAGIAGLLMIALCSSSIAANPPKKNIVETAEAAGAFQTLVRALQAADLVGTLAGQGPFTVFAPTDQAFAKLPQGRLEMLLKPENKDKLRSILLYHVASGNIRAAQAAKLESAKTVNGQELAVRTRGGTLMMDNATVVKADVVCSNGVIHVIDTVLMPKE